MLVPGLSSLRTHLQDWTFSTIQLFCHGFLSVSTVFSRSWTWYVASAGQKLILAFSLSAFLLATALLLLEVWCDSWIIWKHGSQCCLLLVSSPPPRRSALRVPPTRWRTDEKEQMLCAGSRFVSWTACVWTSKNSHRYQRLISVKVLVLRNSDATF